MRAFLSHSSKDKGFVEMVTEELRPGSFELDSDTFDAGLLNSQAILAALKRCQIFCLFLSGNSISSSYVDFETLFGMELFASGEISRIIVFCLDQEAYVAASENAKYFYMIRKSLTPGATARLIQGYMISRTGAATYATRPFVGRESELQELERQVTDYGRPLSKAIFISGNIGSGRRTLARKFYDNQFAHVGKVFPIVHIDEFFGLEEIYRGLMGVLRPHVSVRELTTTVQAFEIASPIEKSRLIAQLINSLLPDSEAIVLFDKGGVLAGSGSLSPEMNGVIGFLDAKPHPPVIIVSTRMIPQKLRRQENDLSYLSLRTLSREASQRLILTLLRGRDVKASDEVLSELVNLGDGHPYNIYRLIDEVIEHGLEPFLANPSDFLEWKHRQSSEYLDKVNLTSCEVQVLAILQLIPELDFTALVEALQMKADNASIALAQLMELHIVEPVADRFLISPALRIAVERDRRITVPKSQTRTAIQHLAQSLSIRIEDGGAPIALIDAAILSELESGRIQSNVAAAFLLPSHNVRMAKRHYDDNSWSRSMWFAKEALKARERISSRAFVAASRYLCLSAARLGDAEAFNEGIRPLTAAARDDWEKSNVAFLEGFNLRLKGSFPTAEDQFRRSHALDPGNISAAREIAAICLARENFDEAETFARQAYNYAPRNPFIIDILLAVLIRKFNRNQPRLSEINELFDRLEKVGDEGARSFFATRKAEFEHLWGNNRTALQLIQDAIRKTPRIFELQRLYAEILLKDGNTAKAHEVVEGMREIVDARDPNERRTNYRDYLNTRAHYLTEVGLYKDAKEIFDDQNTFSEVEKAEAVRGIEIAQAFRQNTRG